MLQSQKYCFISSFIHLVRILCAFEQSFTICEIKNPCWFILSVRQRLHTVNCTFVLNIVCLFVHYCTGINIQAVSGDYFKILTRCFIASIWLPFVVLVFFSLSLHIMLSVIASLTTLKLGLNDKLLKHHHCDVRMRHSYIAGLANILFLKRNYIFLKMFH